MLLTAGGSTCSLSLDQARQALLLCLMRVAMQIQRAFLEANAEVAAAGITKGAAAVSRGHTHKPAHQPDSSSSSNSSSSAHVAPCNMQQIHTTLASVDMVVPA